MKGEKEFKDRKLKYKYRICKRCDKTYLSTTKRGLYCENCKKPLKKNKSHSEKGKILDGV